MHPYDVISSFD